MTTANLQRAARVALTLALTAYGISYARDPGAGRLLDGVDLAIHESGHLVFGAFGEFVQFAGGTIMQLLMPLAFVGYFLRRRDPHAATVALWWVAQNLWNISVYVADARAQELPLVGGGEHDWAYMLGRLGWMARDTAIARGVHHAGVALLVVSSVAGVLLAIRAGDEDEQASSFHDVEPAESGGREAA